MLFSAHDAKRLQRRTGRRTRAEGAGSRLFPETRSDRRRKIAGGANVSICRHFKRQSRKRMIRRAIQHSGVVRRIKCGLMTRTDETVIAGTVQCDRTSRVRAHFRIRNQTLQRVVAHAFRKAHEYRHRLRIADTTLRKYGRGAADVDIVDLYERAIGALESDPAFPSGMKQCVVGRRSKRTDWEKRREPK